MVKYGNNVLCMDRALEKDFVSINEYLNTVNGQLSRIESRVIGEVMEVQLYPGRSYLFFKLKDMDADNPAMLTCMMWKRDYEMSGLELKDGIEIIISGSASVHKPTGRFSFVPKTIELVGEGALKIAYDKLKLKLQNEGLFDESQKRAIPQYPHKIGLITSKGGAVIADFFTNIGKFGYAISLIDSRVEGQLATEELLHSIRTFRNKDIDVLVIIRGGGSLESFLPFNNEILVREVASFPVPVLVGIGHEKDVSLLALASDVMVSTPTAVANYLNESWEQAGSLLSLSEQKIIRSFQEAFQGNKDIVRDSMDVMRDAFQKIFNDFSRAQESLKIGLKSIRDQMIDIQRRLDGALIPVFRKMNFSIANERNDLSDTTPKIVSKGFTYILTKTNELVLSIEKQLTHNDPKRQLKLGYSIVMKNNRILKSLADVQKGDVVTVGLGDGTFDSEVTRINK